MIESREQQAEGRFRTLLAKWLAKLPPGGWEGTSHDLGEALARFADRQRVFAFVPICPGRKVAEMAEFLADHGFAVEHHRTKHARTLRFTRSGGES